MKIYCDNDPCEYNDEGVCRSETVYVETVADCPICMSESFIEEDE